MNDGEGCDPGVCGKICCRQANGQPCNGYDPRCGIPNSPFIEIYTSESPCPPQGGCTNFNSPNYEPCATIDDLSCEISGCMDLDAINYDPAATIQDECVCQYQAIHCGGCLEFPSQDPRRPWYALLTGEVPAKITDIYDSADYPLTSLPLAPPEAFLTPLDIIYEYDTQGNPIYYYQADDPLIPRRKISETITQEYGGGKEGTTGEFCGLWAKYYAVNDTGDARTFRGWVRNAASGQIYNESEIANRCGCEPLAGGTGRCCISCNSPNTNIKQSCTTLGDPSQGGAVGNIFYNNQEITVDCDSESSCQLICNDILSAFGFGPTQNFEWNADCNDGVCPTQTCPGVAEIDVCCVCSCPNPTPSQPYGDDVVKTITVPENFTPSEIREACGAVCPDGIFEGVGDGGYIPFTTCEDLGDFAGDCDDGDGGGEPSSFLGLVGRTVRVVNPIGSDRLPEPRSPERDNKLPLNYGRGTSSFNLVRPPNVAQEARVRSDYFTTKYSNANSYEINYGFYHARKLVNGECVTMMCPTLDGTDNYCRALEDCE